MGQADAPWRNRIVGSEAVPPGDLLANPNNWRTHPGPQRDALRGSLGVVGWVQQVIVNTTTGHLIDGHARVEEAISRDEPTVPVLYVELTPDEEALVLATLDPIGAMADRDGAKLEALLADISVDDAGLLALLGDLAPPSPKAGLTDPDEVPPLGDESNIKRGDLFALGDHRLMCGDSTDAADFHRLLGTVVAAGVFTSPPYLQQRDYNGNMAADWEALMTGVFRAVPLDVGAQVFVNLGPVHRDGRVVRYWDGWIDTMEGDGWPLFGWYVWDKLEAMPGDWNGRLAPAHEFIFHFASAHTQPRKTVESKHGGVRQGARTQRNRDGTLKQFTQQNVLTQTHKIPDSVLRLTPQKGGVEGHVAPFPVGLPTAFIEAYSADPWLDPFGGSGTTIIAAEQLGRRCYAMEIDPRYVAVAIERWEKFTGRTAERL